MRGIPRTTRNSAAVALMMACLTSMAGAATGELRCRGVDTEESWVQAASEQFEFSLLDDRDLPRGWTARGDGRAPAKDDALYLAGAAALLPFCASERDYASPDGPLRVLVFAYETPELARRAASAIRDAAGQAAGPPVVAHRVVSLLAPRSAATVDAWAAAGNALWGRAGEQAFANERDPHEALRRARGLSAFRPEDPFLRAYVAAALVNCGKPEEARRAANTGLAMVGADAQAEAELLHWLGYAEYLLQAPASRMLELSERGHVAAERSGDAHARLRATFNRACARARVGQTDEAFADLETALKLEAASGGRYYRDAAPNDSDLESLRSDPRWSKLFPTGGR